MRLFLAIDLLPDAKLEYSREEPPLLHPPQLEYVPPDLNLRSRSYFAVAYLLEGSELRFQISYEKFISFAVVKYLGMRSGYSELRQFQIRSGKPADRYVFLAATVQRINKFLVFEQNIGFYLILKQELRRVFKVEVTVAYFALHGFFKENVVIS